MLPHIRLSLPHNYDIEKSVLGCLFMGKLDYVIQLSELDFMSEENRAIYSTIRNLYDKKQTVDEITVSDILGNLETLIGLQNYVTTPENINHYMKVLKTYTVKREVIKASLKARELAEKPYDSAVNLKNDVLQLYDIETGVKPKAENIVSLYNAAMQDMEDKCNAKDEERLFTGFYDLDKITAGLHPEEFTIIAARPGQGKSTIAVQIMLNLAKKGVKCLFVSREMSQIQIMKRIIANIGLVDGHKMRFCKALTDTDWVKMHYAGEEICEMPVELNDKLATVQEIRAHCRELKNKDCLDVLIVDYLQLCRSLTKTESRRQEIEDISRQLKEMSLEFKIPVIALSQLSRDSSKAGKEPELHDLRESGSLEQDADNVIFLHIPKETDTTSDIFDIKVMVSKQRNGPTGFIRLKYYRRTFKLCSVTGG